MAGAFLRWSADWRLGYYGLLAAMAVAAAASGHSKGDARLVFASLAAAAVCFVACQTMFWLVRERPARPIAELAARASNVSAETFDRLALFTASILFFIWLAPIKSLIPRPAGFFADPFLADVDRLIFGRDAWEIAHLIPGIKFIDAVYSAWPLTIVFCALVIAVVADRATVRRFFLSWALCFAFLGVGLAFVLASAGPIFGPELGFGFGKLHSALSDARIAMLIHEELWQIHSENLVQVGGGISAAPSMHCALTFLCAIAVRRTRLFVPAAAYAGFIWFGSVYLGWHYAVDGLISLVGVLVIWRASRSMVRQEQSILNESQFQPSA